MQSPKMFWFGRNWKNYVKNVVDEKVLSEAMLSLVKYVPDGMNERNFYFGKVFIDVGCGSGLFSLSALKLGCKEVISFDIQDESLEAVNLLKAKFNYLLPPNYSWSVFKGDILDENIVQIFKEKGDIVYSWGVLHHTGDMYKAISNCCQLVKKGGYLIIAIYNHGATSPAWEKIKRFYNKHKSLQKFLGFLYALYVCIGYMIRRRTFNLYRERGMHVFYDAIDWIGGYPYEYACFDEIKNYVENLGFKLVKAPTILPCEKNKKINIFEILRAKNIGCNEFVFQKI